MTAATAAKTRVLAALENKDVTLDKKERRSLRQSCQKALDAVEAGALTLNQEDQDVLRKGIKFANDAGAECKSTKLRRSSA
jgi:hypothetical protein